MVKKLLTVVLMLGLAQAARAAGPIGDSVAANANRATQSTAHVKQAGANKAMIWTGLAVMAVGAGLAGASVALGHNSISCPGPIVSGTPPGPCVFQSEGSRAARWSGIGLASTGAVAAILGARPRAEVTVGRGAFRVTKVISF